ncbi:MAG: hypothetical protein Q4A71_01270 [Actinomycetaceae bacterium]|nr:hypothetical protein [Actinomycetaceae bacterium]
MSDFEPDLDGDQAEYAPSDVIAVLDRLSEMIAGGTSLPFSANVMVNQAEALELLHNAREALPQDLVAADNIVADASRVLDQADVEAAAIRAEANEAAENEREEASQYARQTTEQAQAQAKTTIKEATERAEVIVSKAHKEAEATIAQANAKAKEIVHSAQQHAEQLISEQAVLAQANQRASEMVANAGQHAQKLATDADAYVVKQLTDLEELLTKIMRQTHGGKETLRGRH